MSTDKFAESHSEQPGDAPTNSAGSYPKMRLSAPEAPLDEPVTRIAVSEAIPTLTAPATTGSGRAARIGLRERLIVFREKAKEERHRRQRYRREGFQWHEREWGSRFWAARLGITPHTLLTVSLVIVAGLFVFLIAARAASRTPVSGIGSTKRQNFNPIIIQQQGNSGDTTGSNTPTAPTYILGVWVSSMSPAGSGVEQVYVRVTENTSTGVNEPVTNVKVQVTSPYGVARSTMMPSLPQGGNGGGGVAPPSDTAVTDANGLVIFNLFYGAGPGTAVFVFATATVNGHHVSSNTVFVAG